MGYSTTNINSLWYSLQVYHCMDTIISCVKEGNIIWILVTRLRCTRPALSLDTQKEKFMHLFKIVCDCFVFSKCSQLSFCKREVLGTHVESYSLVVNPERPCSETHWRLTTAQAIMTTELSYESGQRWLTSWGNCYFLKGNEEQRGHMTYY